MTTLTRRGPVHRMERSEGVDAMTGEMFTTWACPVCGRRERDGTVVVPGDAPTAEDAIRFAEMAQTPAGRLALSGILSRYPLHDRIEVDQAGMLRLAEALGVEGIGPAVRLEFG